MDVDDLTLGRVLEGSNQYLVPLYQRPYSWRLPNWEKLWEDISELAELRKTNPEATHFTGTLVLEARNITAGLTQFLVVDGQQRLTTLSVVLAAITRAWESRGNSAAVERIHEQYVINKYAQDPDLYYRLRPANFDEQVFRDVVEGRSPSSKESKIGNAFGFFKKQLKSFIDDGGELEAIEAAVISGLKFVTITAKSDDNVYRIFESINNTGVRLTQADLVRNFVFMQLGADGDRVYTSLWLPIVANLEPEDVETVFWIDAQWRNPEARKLDVYEEQKRHIGALTSEEIRSYLENVGYIATCFRAIRGEGQVDHAGLQKAVDRFAALKIPSALVLATRILYLYVTGTASADDALQAFRVLESFLVRRAILAIPVNGIGNIAAYVAYNLNDNVGEEVHTRLSQGRRRYVLDEDVREAILNNPRYVQGRPGLLRHILEWILEVDQGRDQIDFDSMTIEHVLPQSLSVEARKEFAATLDPDANVDEAHQDLIHTIGNLTLTNYNTELSNSPFSVKRAERLTDTGVIANRKIAENTQWGPEEIRARAHAMADIAIAIWPGPNVDLVGKEPESMLVRISEVIELIEPGYWTTYGDIAQTVGTVGQVVGSAVSRPDVADGAWRVLLSGGVVSPQFRWHEGSPMADRTCQEVLESEGVRFVDGRADEAQRLRKEDLLERLGVGND